MANNLLLEILVGMTPPINTDYVNICVPPARNSMRHLEQSMASMDIDVDPMATTPITSHHRR